MPEKLSWRDVLEPKYSSLLLSDVVDLARRTGYRYFVFKGYVYSLVFSPMTIVGTVEEVMEVSLRSRYQFM